MLHNPTAKGLLNSGESESKGKNQHRAAISCENIFEECFINMSISSVSHV